MEKGEKFTKRLNLCLCVGKGAGGSVAGAPLGAKEVQLLLAEADGHVVRGDALAVEAGDDVLFFRTDADGGGGGGTSNVGELVVFALGVGAYEPQEGGAGDLPHDEGVQHAVVHSGLRHGHEAAAVIAAVAHGYDGPVAFGSLSVQFNDPVAGDGLEEEVDSQGIDVAALAVQQRAFTVLVHVGRHAGIEAGAGDGQGDAAVDIDGIEGKGGTVPQVLRIGKQRLMVAKILEEIVARADGDDGHGGVVVADDAVGHLVDGTVTAAGIETQLLACLTELTGQLSGVPLLAGQDALNIQPVLFPQGIGHVVDLLAAVLLTCVGIDDKHVFHWKTSLGKGKYYFLLS